MLSKSIAWDKIVDQIRSYFVDARSDDVVVLPKVDRTIGAGVESFAGMSTEKIPRKQEGMTIESIERTFFSTVTA